MSNNMKIRTLVGVPIVIFVIVSLAYAPNLFKAAFVVAAIIAMFELVFAYQDLPWFERGFVINAVITESIIVILGAYTISTSRVYDIVLIISVACLTDIGGYFVGTMFHNQLFRGRPFPNISPKKSWEGLIGGAICEIAIITLFYEIYMGPDSFGPYEFMMVYFGWIVANVGDLFESMTKRVLGIKDAGDAVRNYFPFNFAELLLGGKNGHGGYLDRLDSISLVAAFSFLLRLSS